MSDETNVGSDAVATQESEPAKERKTRSKAKEAPTAEAGTRYWAFARPNMSFAVPERGGHRAKDVNGFNVVTAVSDPVLNQVLETASQRGGGKRYSLNSDLKEVASDISDGEKRLIGSGIDFNAKAFRTAFEGLPRV